MTTEVHTLPIGPTVDIGGTTQRLVFDYPALEYIEEEFGSMLAVTDAIDRAFGSRMLKLVRVGLTAGLRHARMPAAIVTEMLQPPVDLQQMRAYRDAIRAAWLIAFPPSADDNDAEVSADG
jgi:hypothetical protein